MSGPGPARWATPRVRAVLGFTAAAVLLLVVAPASLSTFRLDLLAKYLCYALVGIGIGLAWGRGGLLTLGQGVFFGLGGYVMAMHFKLADAGPGQLPDFMQLYGQLDSLPWWWAPFRNPVVTLLAVLVLPMLLALALGAMIFRRRVRGAYFAILSQALAAALAIFIVGQQATTGGTNGLTDIKSFFGYALDDPVNRRMIFYIIAGAVLLSLLAVRQLMYSRFGELLVACRDAEERVRFLGYDPATVKLVAYTAAAGLAGLGGALFVCAVGAFYPALIGVVPSIQFVIGVAVGGRASLLGPVLGSVAVAWAQTALSERYPAFWNYLYGGLFVLVVAFLPGGLSSLPGAVRQRLSREPARAPDAGGSPGASGTAEATAVTEASAVAR